MGATYKARGTVVGLDINRRGPISGSRTARVKVELHHGGSVEFPWGLGADPLLGDQVLVSMELLEERK